MKLNPNNTGLSLGGLLAIWHASWSALVALGFAQTLLNFVFSIHFLTNPYRVREFNLGTALTLVVVTFVVGYVVGWVFAMIWNKLHRGT